MWRVFVLGMAGLLALTACAGASTGPPASGMPDRPVVTVYKPPT